MRALTELTQEQIESRMQVEIETARVALRKVSQLLTIREGMADFTSEGYYWQNGAELLVDTQDNLRKLADWVSP